MILNDEKRLFLEKLADRTSEIEQLLSFEEILVDPKLTASLKKELSEISSLSKKYQKLKMLELERTEERQTAEQKDEYENMVSQILEEMTNSTENNQFVIVEITPKNKLSDDLRKAYKSVCESQYLKFIEVSTKLKIYGQNAFDLFKNENGLHKSERGTSRVVVFKEPQMDELFREEDVRFDIFHSSGAGGQNINKVSTAIRAIHTKTNLSVVCQDERTQSQNKKKALERLREKYEKEIQRKKEKEIQRQRKNSMTEWVVRVYNYKTNIVKDSKSGAQTSLNEFFEKEFEKILKSNMTRS